VVNITQPPFVGRPDLRKALSMAIDRETLVEHVTGVGERPAYSWVPPGTANYTSQPYQWADLSADERIAEAQQLYRSAVGDGETSPVISLRYDASPNHSRNAEVLSAMWRQTLDATIEPTSKEWKVFLSERHLLELGGLTRLGWVADYNDAQTFLEIFTSRHPQNVTGYADAEYDALLEAARQQTDPQQRRALLEQAERRLLEAYVVIPLYFNVSKHLVKPYIKGFVPNAMNRNQSKHLRLRE
jgi:oligopeptide transport system substrate-binding protein